MVRHLPFIDVLAHPSDEEWHTFKAAYMALLVFDDWLLCGAMAFEDENRLQAVYNGIDDIPGKYTGHAQALKRAMDAMVSSEDRKIDQVVEAWSEYGNILMEESRWSLAADMYLTVGKTFHKADQLTESQQAALATVRLKEGDAFRCAGDYEKAIIAYRNAAMIAKENTLQLVRLQAFIGYGEIALEMNEWGNAARLLNSVIAETEKIGEISAHVRADAARARARLYRRQSDYSNAIEDLYLAYQLTDSQAKRVSLLVKLGEYAMDGGYFHIAERALTYITKSHGISEAKTTAVAHLIRLSTLENDERNFDHWCKEWYKFDLAKDSPVRARALLNIARGIYKFGGREYAKSAYMHAMSVARHVKASDYEASAMNEMAAIQRGTADPIHSRLFPDIQDRSAPGQFENVNALLDKLIAE